MKNKTQRNYVIWEKDFEKLSFEIRTKKKPYFVVMTKTEFKEFCRDNSEELTIYEMAEIAANGGIETEDGTVIRAFVEGK